MGRFKAKEPLLFAVVQRAVCVGQTANTGHGDMKIEKPLTIPSITYIMYAKLFKEGEYTLFYEMEIAGLRRQLTLCKIGEDTYIAAFIMFGDVPLTRAAARELLAVAPPFDVVVTAESKGIPLAYEMAAQSGKEYVVARKGAKLYMEDIVTVSVDSITTAHTQTLCLGKRETAQLCGKRVLLVDDVISTGQSLTALETLITRVGGTIAGRMAVLAEGDAATRTDIQYLAPLPLFHADGRPL